MEIPNPSLNIGSSTRSTRASRRRCSPLHNAVLDGDITLVEQILRAGENPDMGDEGNLTPIMSLFMRHSLQDTRCIFLERNPVQRNLVMDCREEDAERVATTSAILTLCLHYGADPNARSNEEKTPLHYATNDGLFEAAKILLDAGATIDAQDKGGRSPLYCAVQERSLLVTNLLVGHGASIDLKDKNGVSPLSLVIQKQYVDVMQIFLNHHALVATGVRHNFAGEVLLQAVESKSTDIIQFLVENGDVALDYQNAAGETAMHRAIAQGNTHMMETLRTMDTTGQSLRVVTTRGESCFHFAARVASVREMELLLQFREEVSGGEEDDLINSLDISGTTPLFAAATSRAHDKTNMFIDRQAKIKLLLSNGAMLLSSGLPGGSPPYCHSSQEPGIILCAQVRKCLSQWLVECQDESEADLLREFCTKWIANILTKPETMTLLSVLNLSVCAGYAAELLPLALMLPQEKEAIASFLQSLDVFKNSLNGLQFDCLARELSASWISTRRS